VDARATARDERRHRGSVHDMAAFPVRLDPRHECPHSVHHAAEIHSENPIPVIVARLADVVEQVDAGVVAHDVHLPEHLLSLVRGARHCATIRDIQPQGMHFHALEAAHGLIEMILTDVGDDDIHPRSAERFCHAEADATPTPGNEGRHACYVSHGLLQSSRGLRTLSPPCGGVARNGARRSLAARVPWRPLVAGYKITAEEKPSLASTLSCARSRARIRMPSRRSALTVSPPFTKPRVEPGCSPLTCALSTPAQSCPDRPSPYSCRRATTG